MANKSARRTRKRQGRSNSRALFEAKGGDGEKEQSICRCSKCKAIFPADARFCDQCGSRWRRDTNGRDSEGADNATGGETTLELGSEDGNRSSVHNRSPDAKGGSWFWGRERVLPSLTKLSDDGLFHRWEDPKLLANCRESQSIKEGNDFEALPVTFNHSSNQISHSSQSRRPSLDDTKHKARLDNVSTEPVGKLLFLPPLGVSCQRTRSPTLAKANHNGSNEKFKPEDQKHMCSENNNPATNSFALWGPCLDEAISSFQATEIILVAEIDSDEHCMSFLKQQLQLNRHQQCHLGGHASTTRKSPHLTQLEVKVAALEKKIYMNKQKLISVRDRLEELRRSECSELGDNNVDERASCKPVHSDQDRVEDGSAKLPQQGSTDGATEAHRRNKKKKKDKLKRRDLQPKPEQEDAPDIDLAAVLGIQKACQKFKEASHGEIYEEDEVVANTNPPIGPSDNDPPDQNSEDTPDTTGDLDECKGKLSEFETAVIRIQSMYRRRAGRAALRRLLVDVYEKVFDQDSNSYYYYSKRTKQSQWERPVLLGEHDFAGAAESTTATSAASDELGEFGSNLNANVHQHQAAQTIQYLYRTRATRLFLRDLATGKLEKVFDADSGAWYYFNHRTQQSFWEKAEYAQLYAAVVHSKNPR